MVEIVNLEARLVPVLLAKRRGCARLDTRGAVSLAKRSVSVSLDTRIVSLDVISSSDV